MYINVLNHENGNLIEEQFFREGQYLGSKKLEYYESGVVKSLIQLDKDGNQSRVERYNEQSQSIETKVSYGGKTTFEVYTTYDQNGNYLKITNGLSKTTSFKEYEYDEAGNWISAIHYFDDIPKLLSKRYITYY